QKDFLNPRVLDQTLLAVVGYLSVLPMFSPEFVAILPEEQMRGQAQRWEALESRAPDETIRLACDFILRSIYQRLKMEKKLKEVTKRIQINPRSSGQRLTDAALKEQIETLRTQLRAAVRP